MLTALALAALLQTAAAPAPPRVIALARPETATTGPALEVSSTTVAAGGFFPLANSGYGRNHSPSVQWTQGPPATKSYVLIVEDPDAGERRPLLHWLAYDIAPADTTVKDKTRNLTAVKTPVAFSQGPNDHGGIGWTGPHPPVGDPPHHYHLQVFALDRKSLGKPGLEFDKALAAMRGHVLAKGEMVALYRQLPDKTRRDRNAEKQQKEAPALAPAAPTP